MFYRILTGDRFLTALIVFLFAFGIWIPAFVPPKIIASTDSINQMPFYLLINKYLNGNFILSGVIAFSIMMYEAFLMVRINARFVLVQQKTFLPALFFIIITGYSPYLLGWNAYLPSTLFVILTLNIIFGSYNDQPNSYRIFEAGILLGLGSLFYAPLIYLLPFIWISGMVQRHFYWREIAFPFIGFFLPYLFVFAFLFFTNKNILEFLLVLKVQFVFSFSLPKINWIYLSFAIYLLLLVLMASVYLLKVFQFRKIYIRDYFMVLFWLFISAVLIYCLLSGFNIGITYLLAIPVSYILTNYFINSKKSIGNKILLYILLGFSLFLAAQNLFNLI